MNPMNPPRRRIILAAAMLALISGCRQQPAPPTAPSGVADRVVVEKAQRKLTLYRAGRPLKTYEVALGRNPIGHKEREGDGRTPEGMYRIDFHKRNSSFHRALHVSYPNVTDRARALAQGVSPGGDIMIHGLPKAFATVGSAHRLHDWTEGCVAVTNSEIEEIWAAVPDGTPIDLRP
jgi:murein L,D-transpeptidase YafK